MQHISTGASYVQNLEFLSAEAEKQSALKSLCDADPGMRQVWNLLTTPQTVESLSRRLDEEDTDEITASLTKLIRAELIQISPDS